MIDAELGKKHYDLIPCNCDWEGAIEPLDVITDSRTKFNGW
jgi:hypothetical protein